MRIEKHRRFWKVTDRSGRLVCITVFKKGAMEVVRRLRGRNPRHRGGRDLAAPRPIGRFRRTTPL